MNKNKKKEKRSSRSKKNKKQGQAVEREQEVKEVQEAQSNKALDSKEVQATKESKEVQEAQSNEALDSKELEDFGAKRVNIYTQFVQLLEARGGLTQKHREELNEKRGLSDETIKKARLLSGSFPAVNQVIQELSREFTTKDVIDSGLALFPKGKGRTGNKEGGMEPTRFVSDEQVIIPYLSEDSEQVVYLRSHKYGAKDVPLEVFNLPALEGKPKTVVLTEGEFKALALQQVGIPSVAVGGITSFGGEKHSRKLVYHLMQANTKELIILFDNEVKNNPDYPNYKDNPLTRWDTDFWAIKMARLIYTQSKGTISTKVARFPDDWRVEGKVDPDSALANGKTKEEFLNVIKSACPSNSYISKFLKDEEYKEAREVVSWKLKKEEWKNLFPKEKNNRYWWEKERTVDGVKERIEFEISNFIMKPTHTIFRVNGERERVLEATDFRGSKVSLILPEKAISTSRDFRACVTGKHALHWSGQVHPHTRLTQKLDETMPPLVARETEGFGHEKGVWVFGDGLIKPTTKEVQTLGKHGVVWDGLKGYLPLEDTKANIPIMQLGRVQQQIKDGSFQPPNVSEIARSLSQAYGSTGTVLSLAWSLSCVFSDQIFQKHGFFPILGLLGVKKESGKSRLGSLIREQWGYKEGKTSGRIDLSSSGTTPKGLARMLAKYSSLPVLTDEYRNDLSRTIIGILRAVYDRSSSVRANRSNDNKTNSSDIKACLILGGEELPKDPALRSRTIEVPIHLPENTTPDHFVQVNRLMREGQNLIIWTILHSQDLLPDVLEAIDEVKGLFFHSINTTKGRRIAETYAVLVAVFGVVERATSKGSFLDTLLSWTKEELGTLQEARSEEDHLEQFFQSLAVLAWTPSSQEDYIDHNGEKRKDRIVNKRHVAISRDKESFVINLNDAFDVYEKSERQKGRTPFSKATIQNYLGAASFVRKVNTARFEGKRTRGWRIVVIRPDCPESAKELMRRLLDPFCEEQTDTESMEEL